MRASERVERGSDLGVDNVGESLLLRHEAVNIQHTTGYFVHLWLLCAFKAVTSTAGSVQPEPDSYVRPCSRGA